MRLADIHIEVMKLDRIIVKGKSEPVEIYELLSLTGELDEASVSRRIRFAEALVAYRNQDWLVAGVIFSELHEIFNDKTAKIFSERINLLTSHSLGSGWDGVWRMTSQNNLPVFFLFQTLFLNNIYAEFLLWILNLYYVETSIYFFDFKHSFIFKRMSESINQQTNRQINPNGQSFQQSLLFKN